MRVYVNYPTPGSHTSLDPVTVATLYTETGCHGLRLNLDWRNDGWRQILDVALAHGDVLPILDDSTDPGYVNERKSDGCMNAWARMCAEYQLSTVEILNEPKTIPTHTISAALYADTVGRAAHAIKAASPSTRVAVACEAFKAGGTADRSGYWGDVSSRLDWRIVDLASIHPYRYHPDPPSVTRIRWPRLLQQASGRLALRAGRLYGGTRADEHRAWQASANMPVLVTETGWNGVKGLTEAKQARYLVDELTFYRSEGVELVCIYAYKDDPSRPGERWGLLRADGTPKPAAHAIMAWLG